MDRRKGGDYLAISLDFDGEREIQSGTIETLTGYFCHMTYGQAIRILSVMAQDESGQFVKVKFEQLPYTFEDHWAYPIVRVTMPDGSIEEGSYRLDGLA